MQGRPPIAALRPFVTQLWATDTTASPGAVGRERVLPTGAVHIAVRLSGAPLRTLAHERDLIGREHAPAVIGGPRMQPYLRRTGEPCASVGAMLRPGAAEFLVGAPAEAFVDQHCALIDLWGDEATVLRQRLVEQPTAAARLRVFEAALMERLARPSKASVRAPRGLHPAVAHALGRFATAPVGVGTVVDELGLSHRRFVSLFRRTVGLPPKHHCRVLRFRRMLPLAADPQLPWVDAALRGGYADQPHLSREFRALAGMRPSEYRARAPRWTGHVPLD
ncbi:MAG: AraC family transcriptional regulator [Myxococcota bacterium]